MLPSEELALDPNYRGTAEEPILVSDLQWDRFNIVVHGYLNHVHTMRFENHGSIERCVKNRFDRRCWT